VLAKQKKVGRPRSGEQTTPSSLRQKFPEGPRQGAYQSSTCAAESLFSQMLYYSQTLGDYTPNIQYFPGKNASKTTGALHLCME